MKFGLNEITSHFPLTFCSVSFYCCKILAAACHRQWIICLIYKIIWQVCRILELWVAHPSFYNINNFFLVVVLSLFYELLHFFVFNQIWPKCKDLLSTRDDKGTNKVFGWERLKILTNFSKKNVLAEIQFRGSFRYFFQNLIYFYVTKKPSKNATRKIRKFMLRNF